MHLQKYKYNCNRFNFVKFFCRVAKNKYKFKKKERITPQPQRRKAPTVVMNIANITSSNVAAPISQIDQLLHEMITLTIKYRG